MKVSKLVILSVFLIASIIVNYFFYSENNGFKIGQGAEYQSTIRQAIFNLDKSEFSYVVDELEVGNHLPFENWKRDIAFINSELQKTGNINFKLLGDHLNHIPKQVEELTDKNVGYENEIKVIRSQILFFFETLNKVEADLDEDQMKWYREISNDQSKTSKYVEKRLKTIIKY